MRALTIRKSRLRRRSGSGTLRPESAAAEDSSQRRGHGTRTSTYTATTGGKVKLKRFPRQEQCRPRLLSGRLHRWLNEGSAGVPVWYR